MATTVDYQVIVWGTIAIEKEDKDKSLEEQIKPQLEAGIGGMPGARKFLVVEVEGQK